MRAISKMLRFRIARSLPKKLFIVFRRNAVPMSIFFLGVLGGFVITLRMKSNYSSNSSVSLSTQNETNAMGSAIELAKEVRVLCWIMTNPNNHWVKTQYIRRTWGPHCNILLLMSSVADPDLGTIGLPVEEGRGHIWFKVRSAFRYIYKHHLHDADFFMKADEDSLVMPENLRMMLQEYSPDDPVWFGCRFKLPNTDKRNQGYMSGGSGYVLSREAVRRLLEIAFADEVICPVADYGSEDTKMGVCLASVNVTAGESRDSRFKPRFMPLAPEFHLKPTQNNKFWYWRYRFHGSKFDMRENVSSAAVSFHYIKPWRQLTLHYLIYNLTKYGIEEKYLQLPKERPANRKYENLLLYNALGPEATTNASIPANIKKNIKNVVKT